MNIIISIAVTLGTFGFTSVFTLAQVPSRGGPGMHPALRALDIDGDGTLSAEEMERASKSLLSLDKDGDGTISNNELRPDGFGRRQRLEGNGRLRAGGAGEENRQGRGPAVGRRRGGGPRPTDLGESLLDLGEAGIAWYPRLEDGLAEAKRTNRPILFMAAASQCGGIPGVF